MANQRLGEKPWNESPNALVVLSTVCIIIIVGQSIVLNSNDLHVHLGQHNYSQLKNACASTGVVGITFTMLSVVIQESL